MTYNRAPYGKKKHVNPIWSGLFDGRYGPGGHICPPSNLEKYSFNFDDKYTPHLTKIVLVTYLYFVLKSD